MNTYKKLIGAGILFAAISTAPSYGAAVVGDSESRKMLDFWHNTPKTDLTHPAKIRSFSKKIDDFVKNGARLDYVDSNGNCLLHYAMECNNIVLASIILNSPQYLDSRCLALVNRQGHTPITLAIITHKSDLMTQGIGNTIVHSFCMNTSLSDTWLNKLVIDGKIYNGVGHFVRHCPLLSPTDKEAIENVFLEMGGSSYIYADDLASAPLSVESASLASTPATSTYSEEDAKRRAAEQSALTLDQ